MFCFVLFLFFLLLFFCCCCFLFFFFFFFFFCFVLQVSKQKIIKKNVVLANIGDNLLDNVSRPLIIMISYIS